MHRKGLVEEWFGGSVRTWGTRASRGGAASKGRSARAGKGDQSEGVRPLCGQPVGIAGEALACCTATGAVESLHDLACVLIYQAVQEVGVGGGDLQQQPRVGEAGRQAGRQAGGGVVGGMGAGTWHHRTEAAGKQQLNQQQGQQRQRTTAATYRCFCLLRAAPQE